MGQNDASWGETGAGLVGCLLRFSVAACLFKRLFYAESKRFVFLGSH